MKVLGLPRFSVSHGEPFQSMPLNVAAVLIRPGGWSWERGWLMLPLRCSGLPPAKDEQATLTAAELRLHWFGAVSEGGAFSKCSCPAVCCDGFGLGPSAEVRAKENYKGFTTKYFLFRSTRALAQVGAGLRDYINCLGFLGGAGPPHSRFGPPCSVLRRLSAVCTLGASPHGALPRNQGHLLMIGRGLPHQIPGRLLTGRVSELWAPGLHAIDTPLGRLDRTAAEETANHFKLGRPPLTLFSLSVLFAGLQSSGAKCQAVCLAILLLDGMSERAARFAVAQHYGANLDSFWDHHNFMDVVRAGAASLHEDLQLRTQRVTHAFLAALFVVMAFWLEDPLPRA